MSKELLFSVLVNVVGGLLVGYAIGVVPITMTYRSMIFNCTGYEHESSCTSISFASCGWNENRTTTLNSTNCYFSAHETTICRNRTDEGQCATAHGCRWYHTRCVHDFGWATWQEGLYASAMIFGALFGSPLANVFLSTFGRKKTIGAIGGWGLIAAASMTLGWHFDLYFVIVVGAVAIGFSVGMSSVGCPMYCGEMAPFQYKNLIGVLFQVALTFGIMLAAFMGFVMKPDLHGDSTALYQLFQVIIGFMWLVSAVMIPLAVLMPESIPWQMEQLHKQQTNDSMSEENPGGLIRDGSTDFIRAPPERKGLFGTGIEVKHFLVALLLASAQQLSGINAIMNYTPKIADNSGIDALLANLVVMIWNFVTTLIAVALAKRYPPRTTYIISCGIVSISCLLTGIPTFPQLGLDLLPQTILQGIGIFAFIAAFEFGMGPCFYILAQSIFPIEIRALGCGMACTVQFIATIIVNFSFPVAVEGMSGGKNGNQNQGMACMFVIFGVVGLTSTVGLVFFLPQQVELPSSQDLTSQEDSTELASVY